MADQDEFFEDSKNGEIVAEYRLKLFITGASPNSIRAVENIKAICSQYLAGNYQLEIIDVHQQPQLTEGENVIALPLLIKKAPGTERRMIGDMSDTKKVLQGLRIADRL